MKRKTYHPPTDTLRYVLSPDGRLIADIHKKLPADNPLYLGATPEILSKAQQAGLIEAWFGVPVSYHNTLPQIQHALSDTIRSTLGLCHKSGATILGLEAVMTALEERETELVIIANDAGGADKKRLLNNPLTRRYCYEFVDKQTLGHIFKRRAQVYLAIRDGELAQKCKLCLRLYTRFNGIDAL